MGGRKRYRSEGSSPAPRQGGRWATRPSCRHSARHIARLVYLRVRGGGHHSLRRKFGDGAAVQELQSRKELGLSTAAEDVMHATARKLGQRSIASQTPYQRAVRSGTRESTVAKLSQTVEEQNSVIADQDEEIRRLRLEVERAKAGLQT